MRMELANRAKLTPEQLATLHSNQQLIDRTANENWEANVPGARPAVPSMLDAPTKLTSRASRAADRTKARLESSAELSEWMDSYVSSIDPHTV